MLRHHVSLALRNARRSPLAAVVNVLTLAIGLTCFLTAYAFVAFLERADEQFPRAGQTYVLTQSFKFVNGTFARSHLTRTPEGAAEALAAHFPNVEAIRAIPIDGDTSVANGDMAVRLAAVAVDPGFLDAFPLPLSAGDPRVALRAPRSAVLTREAAARLFGAGEPLGRPLKIANSIDATVTGVIDAIPEPSHFGRAKFAPLRFEVLVSMDVRETLFATLYGTQFAQMQARSWGGGSATTYLVLPETLTASDVERELPDFVLRRVPEAERAQMEMTFGLLPVRDFLRASVDDELFSSDFGVSVSSVLLVLGAVVLGVACVNYANLATARATRRVREVGVRKALGAGPRQIALQHLLEAALLTVIALLVALVAFRAALPALETASGMNLGALLFGGIELWAFLAVVAVLATLAAGAYPALVLSRVAPIDALRSSLSRLGAKRLSAWLVGAQFAAASLLVIAVTVTWLQNEKLVRTGLGAVGDPLLLIENESTITRIDPQTLRAELERIPGVRGVAEAMGLPWQRLVAISFVGASPDAAAERKRVLMRAVGTDFFSVLGIDVLAGRTFRDDDARPGPPDGTAARVIVDRAFVEQFRLGSPAAAIDRLVYAPGSGGAQGTGAPMQIIGVVENRRLTFRGAGAEAALYSFSGIRNVTYVRIAANDVGPTLAGIDAVWRRLAPNVAIGRRFFDEAFDQAYETFARLNQVFRALSMMALAISTAGLVGMATLTVTRRYREIGVRKTFGATVAQVTLMLLGAFSLPVVLANAIVWPLAYLAARAYLRAFLDPVALGPAPFVLALAVTVGIAWAAVGAQTIRAARLNPADVLRNA